MSAEVFEGKTVDEALEKAAAALGVSVDELEHDEPEQKSDDFWGLGDKIFAVRAWVAGTEAELAETAPASEPGPEPEPEPGAPVEPLPAVDAAEVAAEAPAARSFFGAEVVGEDAEAGAAAEVEPAPEDDEQPDSAGEPEVEAEAEADAEADEAEAPTDAEAPTEGGAETETAALSDEDAAVTEQDDAGVAAADSTTTAEDDAAVDEAAVELLESIFDAMDFDCSPEARIDGDVLQVAISGDDNQYFLDGRGRGLAALELILNHAFRHRSASDRKKIRVDAGDFRSRREDEIRDLAYQVSHQAKETDTVQETQPLNPYERRIVHLTLADDPRVTTRSEGTGFLKAVSVIPKAGGRRRR